MKTALCGAKTRIGTPCRRRPISGKKRCKLHGGASTGPRRGHGVYADAFTPEETEAANQAGDTLVQELLVARVQLRRALLAWERWSEVNAESLPPEEHTRTLDAKGEAVTTRRRRPNLWKSSVGKEYLQQIVTSGTPNCRGFSPRHFELHWTASWLAVLRILSDERCSVR